MKIALISSLEDKASINIKENLFNNFKFKELAEKFDDNNLLEHKDDEKIIRLCTINSELIRAEDIDNKINADLFIFISRHQAKEERKSLTVHIPGNFGKAEFGGKEKRLCVAPASYFKNIFVELNKNVENYGYEASLEVTHHGPFLEKPALFIEIGTTEKEWEDKDAGNIIAKSLIDGISNKKMDYESVFVVGGSHYNHVANKTMLKSNYAVGHICAKYNLENLDENLINESMEKTIPKAKLVLLDWKGLGKEKQRILKILEKSNITFRRDDQFFKKDNNPI